MDNSSSHKPFAWPVRVYYEDTDAQGRVYFANYFKFMERARTEWLRYLGVEQDVLLHEERRFFVVVESRADFLIPANFNDELLVTVDLLKVSRASFLIRQEIYREHSASQLLCRGTTRAAFLNVDTYKPVKVPPSMFEDPEK
ncbi:MAG: YbgC/FadM family acyl-CoA thioesterase [Proteobacteria bacterium]|nr:YbgC/FadM family acyl-CoA thioesterase [Pseudomonadota bacterium]